MCAWRVALLAAGSAVAGPTTRDAQAGGCVMTILLVDDEVQIRWLISELLTEEGYTVAQAANGHKALTYLQAANPLPSLILLDMMMPIMNGWGFLYARQRDPVVQAIPVVLISA